MAGITHEADLDDRYDAAEAPGFGGVLCGMSVIGDDEQTLAITKPLFDGLYEHRHCRAQLSLTPHFGRGWRIHLGYRRCGLGLRRALTEG